MYTSLLSKYLTLPASKIRQEMMFETQNGYEFEMAALLVNGEWYVAVEGADSSRVNDIDEVIDEEFNATIKGWCVLKSHLAKIGTEVINFSLGDQKYDAITYHSEYSSSWLLKVEPRASSRLLAA